MKFKAVQVQTKVTLSVSNMKGKEELGDINKVAHFNPISKNKIQ